MALAALDAQHTALPGNSSLGMAGTKTAGSAALAHSCESLLPTTARRDLQEAREDGGCAFTHSHDTWDNSSGDKAAQQHSHNCSALTTLSLSF